MWACVWLGNAAPICKMAARKGAKTLGNRQTRWTLVHIGEKPDTLSCVGFWAQSLTQNVLRNTRSFPPFLAPRPQSGWEQECSGDLVGGMHRAPSHHMDAGLLLHSLPERGTAGRGSSWPLGCRWGFPCTAVWSDVAVHHRLPRETEAAAGQRRLWNSQGRTRERQTEDGGPSV